MAYVLFALSALMIAFGIYSLVTGYPVVQVEEGWTAVISGSTFIAGGILTGALGLVLRVLVQIRNGLGATRPATLPEPETIADEAPAIAPDEPPAVGDVPETALPPAIVAPALALGPAVGSEPAKIPAAPPPAPKPPVQEVRRSLEETKTEQPAQAAALDDDWLDHALAHSPDAPTPIHDPGPSPEPEPEPVPELIPEPVVPPPFSHAREAPPAPPPTPPIRREPPAAAPPPEPELEAPPVAPELEPEPAAEHQDHELPVASAKVIGRYEADGTSYVMYADGSIEAQTESGVYRFASMAELKSFIET